MIGGRSGHHAVIIGQVRGAGYLGDMQGFALPLALLMIAAIAKTTALGKIGNPSRSFKATTT